MHYHRKNNYHDSYRIPGTAAYAVTVQGATKLLASLKKNGWEQSDYFVNNKYKLTLALSVSPRENMGVVFQPRQIRMQQLDIFHFQDDKQHYCILPLMFFHDIQVFPHH